MQYVYEIGITYASENKKVAEEFDKGLTKIFGKDAVFYDKRSMDSNAKHLQEALYQKYYGEIRNILLLYSDSYFNAKFTQPEYQAIIKRLEEKDEDFNLFIVNLENHDLDDVYLKNHIYYPLTEHDAQAYEVLIEKIKQALMRRYIAQKPLHLSVISKGDTQSIIQWDKKADWSFLFHEFVAERPCRLAAQYRWEDVIQWFKRDFIFARKVFESHEENLIHLNLTCHLSIAFLAGYLFGNPFEKTRYHLVFTNNREMPFLYLGEEEKEVTLVKGAFPGNDAESKDLLLILNIQKKPSQVMSNNVLQYCQDKGIAYYKRLELAAELMVDSGGLLKKLAQEIESYVCMEDEKRTNGKIHVFANTLAPLLFLMGGLHRFFGNIQLYEYDMENPTYIPSFCSADI